MLSAKDLYSFINELSNRGYFDCSLFLANEMKIDLEQLGYTIVPYCGRLTEFNFTVAWRDPTNQIDSENSAFRMHNIAYKSSYDSLVKILDDESRKGCHKVEHIDNGRLSNELRTKLESFGYSIFPSPGWPHLVDISWA